MELKKGKQVFITKENPKIQNTPTSGRIHSIGTNHVVLKTAGGTGMYKVHKDNISHDRNDSWMSQKYKKEEAPANAVGGGNIAGMGVGPDGEPGMTAKAIKRYKKKNKEQTPRKVMGFADFSRK